MSELFLIVMRDSLGGFDLLELGSVPERNIEGTLRGAWKMQKWQVGFAFRAPVSADELAEKAREGVAIASHPLCASMYVLDPALQDRYRGVSNG